MSLESEFDAQTAKAIVEEVSFPRMIGSEGSEKAVQLIQSRFTEIGISLKREDFMATKFWTTTMTQLGTAAAIVLTLIMLALSFYAPVWNFIIVLAILFLVIWGLGKMGGSGGLALKGTPIPTCNLVASVEPQKETKQRIIFMGHHDSKSQVLTTVQRSAFFTFGGLGVLIEVLGFFIQGILALFDKASPTGLLVITYIGVGLVLCCATPLTFNTSQNKSPGALDNASSIAAIYLLGKYYKKSPLQNTEVRILITGAEEFGMLGAQDYVKKHLDDLKNIKTFVINFDMIGRKDTQIEVLEKVGFPVGKPTCEELNLLANEKSQGKKYHFGGFYLPTGAATDAYVFRNHGIVAMDFVNKKAAFETHSVNDKPDKFDSELAKQFIVVAAEIAQCLDEKI